MEKNHCQSCSMPIDKPEFQGTEKDGSKSKEYCVYCYRDGAFINPNITLAEMKELVKSEMEKRRIEQPLINMAVNSLPYLKRWGVKTAVI